MVSMEFEPSWAEASGAGLLYDRESLISQKTKLASKGVMRNDDSLGSRER